MKKRILSLFMILALLLGVLPLFGFSEEEIATPIILVGGQNDTVEVWDDTVSALLASGYTEKELTIVLFGIAPESDDETEENEEEQSGIEVRYIDPTSSVNDAVSELIDVSMEFYFAIPDSLPPDIISHFTGGIPAVTALYGRPDLFGKVVTLGTPFSGFPEEVAKNEYVLHDDYVSGSTALFNLYAYAAESDEEFDGRVLNISGVGDGVIIPGDGILPAYALSLDEEDSRFLSYPAYRVSKKQNRRLSILN